MLNKRLAQLVRGRPQPVPLRRLQRAALVGAGDDSHVRHQAIRDRHQASADRDQPELPLPDAAHVVLLRGGQRAGFDPRARLVVGALEQVGVAREIAGAQLRQARLPRAEEVARARAAAGRARRSRSRRSSRPSPSAARARRRTTAPGTAARRSRRARRGRRGRAAGAAATGRSARRARPPSRSRSARPRRPRRPSWTTRMCSSPAAKRAHHRFLLVALHPAVQQRDRRTPGNILRELLGHRGRGLQVDLLRLLDQRIDHVDLPAAARPPRASARRPRRAASPA